MASLRCLLGHLSHPTFHCKRTKCKPSVIDFQVFLSHGAALRQAHLSYWGNHPRAVCVLEKHRWVSILLFSFFAVGNFLISCRRWLIVSSGTGSTPGWTLWLEETFLVWCFSQPDSRDLSSSSSGWPAPYRRLNNIWRMITLIGVTHNEALVSTKRWQGRQPGPADKKSWS